MLPKFINNLSNTLTTKTTTKVKTKTTATIITTIINPTTIETTTKRWHYLYILMLRGFLVLTMIITTITIMQPLSCQAERDFNFNDSQVPLIEPKDEPAFLKGIQDPYAVELSQCHHGDSEIILSLVLKDYNWHDLSEARKAKVLKKLSSFFAISRDFITMESVTKHELYEMQKHSLKRGNNKCHIKKDRRKLGRVNFMIGCGTAYFSMGEPIAKQINQQVKDGSLDNITGEKFGWWIIWRKPYKAAKSLRQRREIEGSGDDDDYDEDDYVYDDEEEDENADDSATEVPTTTSHIHRHHHGSSASQPELTANTLELTNTFDNMKTIQYINNNNNHYNDENMIESNVKTNKPVNAVSAPRQATMDDDTDMDAKTSTKIDSNLLLLNAKGSVAEEIEESVSQLESVITKTIENTENFNNEAMVQPVIDQDSQGRQKVVEEPAEKEDENEEGKPLTGSRASLEHISSFGPTENINLNSVYDTFSLTPAESVEEINHNNAATEQDFHLAEIIGALAGSSTTQAAIATTTPPAGGEISSSTTTTSTVDIVGMSSVANNSNNQLWHNQDRNHNSSSTFSLSFDNPLSSSLSSSSSLSPSLNTTITNYQLIDSTLPPPLTLLPSTSSSSSSLLSSSQPPSPSSLATFATLDSINPFVTTAIIQTKEELDNLETTPAHVSQEETRKITYSSTPPQGELENNLNSIMASSTVMFGSTSPVISTTTPEFSTTTVAAIPITTTTTSTSSSTTTSTTTTTTTTALPDYAETKLQNSPPLIKMRLQKLAVTSGKSFKFIIPSDTFYDNEDLTNLRLDITDQEDHELKANSWLQFDAESKEIYGLPLDDAVSKWQYRLTATDSGNESVTETLEISVQQHRGVRSVNHEINVAVKINEKNVHYIDWQIKLINAIANTMGDANANSIVVKEIRQTAHDPHAATLVYFNETLPTTECPEMELNNLVKHLDAHRLSDLVYPMLGIKSITGQLIGPCQKIIAPKPKTPSITSKNSPPVPRNQVDRVVATTGHLLVYKVPSDTFFDTNDNVLTLTLKTKDNKELNPRHWLQFDTKNQEFYGIPKGGDIGSEEYLLVAEDSGGLTAADALVVQVNHAPKREFIVYFKIYLAIRHEQFNADLQRKFVERIAQLFGDDSPQHIQIRSVTTHHDADGTIVNFYNNTMYKVHSRCPEEEIEALRNVYLDGHTIRERVRKILGPDLNITNVQVTTLGVCNPQTDVTHREFIPNRTEEPLLKSTFSEDYMFTIILPAIIIVSMILIAALVACCLHRRRRKSGKMELGDEEERKSFKTKGIPVIFQDELDEKPEIGNKSPIILKDEKPPLLPPSYNTSTIINGDDVDEYVPPPAVLMGGGIGSSGRESRGKSPVTPSYRKPPPYVSP